MLKTILFAALVFGATSATAFENASRAELKEFMAFLLNTNGYLCERVSSVSATSTADVWRVGCPEGTYLLNARTGSARRN